MPYALWGRLAVPCAAYHSFDTPSPSISPSAPRCVRRPCFLRTRHFSANVSCWTYLHFRLAARVNWFCRRADGSSIMTVRSVSRLFTLFMTFSGRRGRRSIPDWLFLPVSSAVHAINILTALQAFCAALWDVADRTAYKLKPYRRSSRTCAVDAWVLRLDASATALPNNYHAWLGGLWRTVYRDVNPEHLTWTTR